MIRRILFVNSLDADYLEDLTFAGLTEVLGGENVVSYPTNHSYYFSLDQYPRNIGRCRTPLSYVADRMNIGKRLRSFEFDAVVLGSAKKDSCGFFLRVRDAFPKAIPVIFLDGGDRPEIGGDAIREGFTSLFDEVLRSTRFDVIFKREYLPTSSFDSNVIPFPFSFKSPAVTPPSRNKKYDVSFWAVESHSIRSEVFGLIKGRFDCDRNGTTRGHTFRSYNRKGSHFLEELAASRISYNFRGVGWDTLRYWETPGVGSFMISGKPQIQIPNNFEHGRHVVFCGDDLKDLVSLTEYYLRHEEEREEMARAAHAHLNQHHTYLHRAQQFLEDCNRHIGMTSRLKASVRKES